MQEKLLRKHFVTHRHEMDKRMEMQLKFLLADNKRQQEEFKHWKYVRQSQDDGMGVQTPEEKERFEKTIKEAIRRDWLPINSPLSHTLPDDEPGHAMVETGEKASIESIEKGYRPKLDLL